MIIFHYISKLSIHIIYISCFSRSVNEKSEWCFIYDIYIYIYSGFFQQDILTDIYIFSAQTSIFSVNYPIISIYDIYIYIIHILYIKYYTSYIIYKMFQWYLSIYIYLLRIFSARYINWYIYIFSSNIYIFSQLSHHIYIWYIYIIHILYIKYYTSYIIYKMFQWYLYIYISTPDFFSQIY